MKHCDLFLVICCLLGLVSCRTNPLNVFKPASPHEMYERSLRNSGLAGSSMGKEWIDLSQRVIREPVNIDLPFREEGYFPAERVEALAWLFPMQRGQKLNLRLTTKPGNYKVYADVWEMRGPGDLRHIASLDTLTQVLSADADRTGNYVVRLQPELLAGVSYTVEIFPGPSLEYPLKTYRSNQIRSFWDDERDAGARRHEGIDIFSEFRTPVLAVAPGRVTRVGENNLGGKVVWFRPQGKDYTLYYAHLDEQIAVSGQEVKTGDTLGLMGNTGNARSTPPHLHLGIYTSEGAVNPLPYINPRVPDLPAVRADVSTLGSTMRTTTAATMATNRGDLSVPSGTIVRINAASSTRYRLTLPDGRIAYSADRNLVSTTKPLRSIRADDQTPVLDRADTAAAIKARLRTNERVQVLGNFADFELIRREDDTVGWIPAN